MTIDISQMQKRDRPALHERDIGQLRNDVRDRAQPDSVIRESDHIDMRPKRKQSRRPKDGWISGSIASPLLVQFQMTFRWRQRDDQA
jgi:hypothetical protein